MTFPWGDKVGPEESPMFFSRELASNWDLKEVDSVFVPVSVIANSQRY